MHFFIPYLLYFFIYSFLGWGLETLYATIKARKFVKRRGTFTNYFLPLYGGCAVMIITVYSWIPSEWAAALISGILVTVFEYITGWVLDHQFQMRLWDYSTCKWHLSGYVCLPFTIIWCVLAYFLASFIHPYMQAWVMNSSFINQLFSLTICILFYGVDLIVTKREESFYY